MFNGSDGGVQITALTLDMSAAGAATFNDKITAVGTSVFTNLDISGDIDVDGTTNLDAVDIDGAVDMASTLTVADDANFDSGTLFVDASADRVGIGTTSASHKLHLSEASTDFAALIANSTSSGNGLKINAGDNSGDRILQLSDKDGNEKLRVGATGLVGIGTTSPQAPIHTVGDSSFAEAAIFANNGDASSWARADWSNDQASGTGIVYRDNSGNFVFRNDNSSGSAMTSIIMAGGSTAGNIAFYKDSSNEIARFDSDGKLGIGISPGHTLDVSGEFRVNGGGSGSIVVNDEDSSLCPTMTFLRNGAGTTSNDFIKFENSGGEVASINSSGGAIFSTVSKGSGSFKIAHPLESKKDTHNLVHSFLESPQADLIYRGRVDLVDGLASVNIDMASDMTDGTFVLLCRDVQSFTTNESGWTAVRSSVDGNILTIEAQDNTCTDSISWMVVGERQDEHMYNTDWTDENGKVIVEPLIPEPTPEEKQEPEAQESETELSPEERLNVMSDPLKNLQEEE